MGSILLQLFPVFAYFLLGILLRRCGLGDKSHGEFLLRLVFFVTLPLLILGSVPSIEFTAARALLPFLNVTVNLVCMGLTLGYARMRNLERRTTGTMLVNTGIVNNSFMFPFILAVYGQNGFADAILFDFGNALLMATAVYALAYRYSDEQSGGWPMLKRIMKSPLVWSLLVSVLLSVTDTAIPAGLAAIMGPLAQMSAPLILISLGLHFSLQFSRLPLALATVGIRMFGGLLVGLVFVMFFELENTTKNIVILCCSAPIGFNALTYSSLAKLDVELSASAVSISILAGIFTIPILIFLLGT